MHRIRCIDKSALQRMESELILEKADTKFYGFALTHKSKKRKEKHLMKRIFRSDQATVPNGNLNNN